MESRWSPALGALLGLAPPVLASLLPLPLPASRSASEFPFELVELFHAEGALAPGAIHVCACIIPTEV